MSQSYHKKSNSNNFDDIIKIESELNTRRHDLEKSVKMRRVRYILMFFRYFAEALVVIFTWLKVNYLIYVIYVAVAFFLLGAFGDIINPEDEVIIKRDIDRLKRDLEESNLICGRPNNLLNIV